MNIENLTQDQIDALTAAATGTVKIVPPTVAGSLSFTPMAGCTVKINGFPLVAGVDWTAATSAAATATSLAAAITTATADCLCTAAVDGTDTSLVVITANSDGPDGNAISISATQPDYTFPSGPHLTGGALPLAGDLVYNSDDSVFQGYDGSSWSDVADLIAKADASTDGYLAKEDWSTFNGKTKIQVLAGDPVSPVAGQIWFDTGTHTWRAYDGTDKGTLTFTADV